MICLYMMCFVCSQVVISCCGVGCISLLIGWILRFPQQFHYTGVISDTCPSLGHSEFS